MDKEIKAIVLFLFALVMLEHADDGKRHVVDEHRFTDGNDFAPRLFRRTPKLIASGCADNADIARHLVINFIEHAPVFDDMLVHLESHRPNPVAQPWPKFVAIGRQRSLQTHLWREPRHEWRAFL